MKITREHKAGLELAHQKTGFSIPVLADLIRKASAAPEQEAVTLPARLPVRMPQARNLPEGYAEAWNDCLTEVEKLGPLYTHADPSEVAQLRADKQYLQRTIDGMNEAHAEVAWRLSEAQAIMGRVLVKEWLSPNCPLHKRIDAFLSDTARPAEGQTDA